MPGKINISGLKLEISENLRVNKIINTYIKKISNLVDFKELDLHLKKSKHGKTYLHKATVSLKTTNGLFVATVEDYNLYKILSETMKKILHEIQHTKRTRRQIKI